MTRPRFLADEDLRGSIISAVRRQEPALEITSVVAQGLSGASDDEVLDFAWRERWLVVSHDVNTMRAFAERRLADGRCIHGLFLAPQSRSTKSVTECLLLIWSASDFEEWRDRVVYLPF
jgi:predicted nuclease of predicted toxin-antitoxin system